jgi:hypothetical protein
MIWEREYKGTLKAFVSFISEQATGSSSSGIGLVFAWENPHTGLPASL